ncbi:GRAM domain-containing protein 2B isoform X1 [Octopus bimaculoides]|uniref:GRAM domain-containing protein 2B isoform X1 n=1 Tax=Octopus bimaculoides TaxID=37653 RepID=UPI0022E439A3|nr:GRAM domain-containing protein 2B isoform X1 [Octopus bimaculoides]XP_052829798.1 GRAM domain-containing protein 2B isoform X1 [Octopus bimaculoides]
MSSRKHSFKKPTTSKCKLFRQTSAIIFPSVVQQTGEHTSQNATHTTSNSYRAPTTTPSTPDKDEGICMISASPSSPEEVKQAVPCSVSVVGSMPQNEHLIAKPCSSPVAGMKKYPGREMLLHVPTVSKSKVAKFHKLFKSVPRSESLIDHYSCAYQGDILLQGHLYISLGWFCFYSKIRGRGRHIEIPLDNVLCVTKEKTAFIIPNAIGVQTTTEKYVFGSFVSRDAAYNLMQDLFDRYQELSGDSFAEESGISAKFNESGVAALAKSTLSMPLSKNNLSGAIIHPLIPKRKSHSESSVFCSDYSGVAETTDSEDNKLCQPGKTKTYKRTPVKATIPCVKTQFTSSTPTKPQVSQKPSSVGSSHSKKPVTVHNSWFIMPYLSQCFNCQQTYESICQLALKLLRLPKAHMVLAICAAIMIFLLVSAVTLTYKVLLIQAKLDTLQVWSPALKNLYRDKIHSDIYMMRAQSHSALVQQLHLVLEANIHVLEEVSVLNIHFVVIIIIVVVVCVCFFRCLILNIVC